MEGERERRRKRFASVEKGDAFLRRGGMLRQNASLVCAVCWSVFASSKTLY